MSNSLLGIASQRGMTMTSKQVTDYLNQFNEQAGIATRFRHDSVKRSIKRLFEQRVIELPPLVGISTGTKPVTAYLFSGENGRKHCITLVAQLSPLHTSKIVDRWLELENGTPDYSLLPSKLQAESTLFECAARVLNISPSGRLQGMRHIALKNGLDVSILPDYVDDGQESAHSATELLKRHGVGIQASAFNKLLERHGILAQQQRKSTSKKAVNGMKTYWNITSKGQEFGKNLSHEKAAGRETQPFWYDDKFSELLAVIGLN